MGKYWFFHLRIHRGGRVLPRGGITVCAREIDGGMLRMGAALCSGFDTFCKKTGREIAQRRADADTALYDIRYTTEVPFSFDRHRPLSLTGQVQNEAEIWATDLFVENSRKSIDMAKANDIKRPKVRYRTKVRHELRDVRRQIAERRDVTHAELLDRMRVLEDMLVHRKGTKKPCS